MDKLTNVSQTRVPKFIQIVTGNDDSDHTLYALDEDGDVWVLKISKAYGTRWDKMPMERYAP
jgi:hypothetical protein